MQTETSLPRTACPKTVAGCLRAACARRLLLVLVLALPAVGQAQFNYTTNNDTIMITGYTGSGGDVTIPSTTNGLPVTGIAGNAFWDCYSLTSVTIPNSVTSIGGYAFGWCTNLTNVMIGNSVTNIGAWAFFECTGLPAITVDPLSSVYSSADGVLFNKSQTVLMEYPGGKAGSYAIPTNVTNIADYAFCLCTSVTNITIPNSVTSIGYDAFAGCSNLTSVTIGNGVTNIGDYAFSTCTSLASVTIPDSVTHLGNSAFWHCSNLTSISIGNSITSIGNSAFIFCTSLISVIIPRSVTDIGMSAFADCTSLTSIGIPSSVTSIGDGVFSDCTHLTTIIVDPLNSRYSSIDGVLFNKSQTLLIQYPGGKAGVYRIPNSVTSIGDGAFGNCTGLTSVTIPNRVASIGEMAFANSTSLSSLYFEGNAPDVGWYAFAYDFLNFSVHYINATVFYLPGTTGWTPTFGNLATAPRALPNPAILNNGPSFGVQTSGFGFLISWASNVAVVVEASTNLTDPTWTPASTNTLASGSSYFTDPQGTNYPSRFYRLRSP
jgi:hypothetical protein